MKPEDLIFDEEEAVKFIMNYLPSEVKEKVSENEIDYILDIMCEYYEENGLMDENSTDEASIDEEAMFNFISKILKKDKQNTISDEDLQWILDGEFEYGKSIGIYTEEG